MMRALLQSHTIRVDELSSRLREDVVNPFRRDAENEMTERIKVSIRQSSRNAQKVIDDEQEKEKKWLEQSRKNRVWPPPKDEIASAIALLSNLAAAEGALEKLGEYLKEKDDVE